jgi:hypothetical protein
MQRAEDVQCGGRGVEADAVANTPVAGRVVGEDQRHALFGIGQARQIDPAARQFGDKIHALGLRSVANHIGLTALAAPRQILEADRPG